MFRVIWAASAIFLILLAATVPAHAQITLRFTPSDTTIVPGGGGRLSIMLDDAIDVRTVNVVVTYDTTIVRSLGGGKGLLYTNSGLSAFTGFEEDTLGQWNGYAVILAAGQGVTGPGELYWWDFETLIEGVSPIISLASDLSNFDRIWYPDVSLAPTTIIVGDPSSAADDLPGFRSDLRLRPNPFNPRTEIVCDLERAGWLELAIYDVRGRQVLVLHDGSAAAGRFTSSWDGLDSRGLAQPGGVYIFRMSTSAGATVTKGVLLK